MTTLTANIKGHIDRIKTELLDGNDFDNDDRKFMENLIKSAAWRANPSGVAVYVNYETGHVTAEMKINEDNGYFVSNLNELIERDFS